MSHVVQNVVIGAVVAASVLAVARHMLPQQMRRVTQRLLDWLVRRGVAIPRRWRDVSATASGCGACTSCASSQCERPAQELLIRLYRRTTGKSSR